jgi:fatty acid-binding protein DegV
VKEKIRTKRKAMARTLDLMAQLARDGEEYDGKVFISNSECLGDAEALAQQISARFAQVNGPVEHFPIGATIGVHTGPGTVALFYWGKPRA